MSRSLKEQFECDGFSVIKDVFTIEEISNIRKKLQIFADKMTNTSVQIKNTNFPDSKFFHADLCAVEELKDYDYMVFNPKITNIIKEILGSRINNGKIEFLIWWKGYQRNKSTWEPEENLKEDVNAFLDLYKEHNPHYFIENININGN